MKVYFYTLGCRVNQYETDAVREHFLEAGFELTENPEDANVCVVNTCTVTSEADRKSRQSLRKMARLNPNAIICAMGCAAEMTDGFVDADVVCGTRDKHLLLEKLQEYISSNAKLDHKSEHSVPPVTREDTYADFGTVLSPEGTRAFVKIEDGCNNFCTYCIIPFARGRVASREKNSILEEVRNLSERGFSEICLTGIHLCSYGKDRNEDIMSLLDVIEEISKFDGVKRISLGSLEPKSITDDFIKGLASIDKISPHFHLSLQSGSDTVLKRMNRHYSTELYLDRVNELRKYYPNMSLTTDVICGFPEETDEEFQETIDFVKKARFNKIHVFPYSIRKGTKAASMNQVDGAIKKERSKNLIEWSNGAETDFANSFVDKDVEVLVEAYEKTPKGTILKGYTNEYVYTLITSDVDNPEHYIGKIIEVKAIGVANMQIIAKFSVKNSL